MTEKKHRIPEQQAAGEEKQGSDLSRRDFLHVAGCAAVGGVAAVAGGTLLAGKTMAADAPAAPPLPWKYEKLDPKEAGKRGYHNYLEKGG